MVAGVETNNFAYDLIAKMINPTPEDRIPLENVIEVLKSFSSIDDDDDDSSRYYLNTKWELSVSTINKNGIFFYQQRIGRHNTPAASC